MATAVSEIQAGSGSTVTDLSLGVTGATVGQIAKISAVDANGKPTAWEPVDMPSGGGGASDREWTKITGVTVAEDTTLLIINEDDSGNSFEFDRIRVVARFDGTSQNTAENYVECKAFVGGATNGIAPVNISYAKRKTGSVVSVVYMNASILPSGNTVVRIQASSGNSTIAGNNIEAVGAVKLTGVRLWASGSEYIGAGTEICVYGANWE